MGITVQQETGNIAVLTITGVLKKSELSAIQTQAAKHLDANTTAKLLIVVDNFQGWDRTSDWDDISFYAEHGEPDHTNRNRGRPKMGNRFNDVPGGRYPKGARQILPFEPSGNRPEMAGGIT